jgi:hypothetical protein
MNTQKTTNMIVNEQLQTLKEMFESHPYFKDFPIYFNRKGTLVVKTSNEPKYHPNSPYQYYLNKYKETGDPMFDMYQFRMGIQYRINVHETTFEGQPLYCLRCYNGSPNGYYLNYDRHTCIKGFLKIEDLFEYFIKYWEKYKLNK